MTIFKKSLILSAIVLSVVALFLLFCAEDAPDYCGDGQPINRHTQFCYNGKTYDKCGGNDYDPTVYFCDNISGGTYPLCGGKGYFPATEFCYVDKVHERCGGEIYDPASERCDNGTIVDGITSYALEISANPGDGGTVSRDPNPENARYEYNTEVTLKAVPSYGFRFHSWSGNITTDSLSDEITITMSGNVTLTANFRPAYYELKTSTNPADAGRITVESDETPEGGKYKHGAYVTLKAEPDTGYSFTGWSGTVDSTKAAIRVRITDDFELTANFELIKYNLTVVAGENGTVNVDPPETSLEYGTSVTVTATPNEISYEFDRWSAVTGNLPAGVTGESGAVITFTIKGDVNIKADFKPVSVESEFIDTRDGGNNQRYRTVTIGSQVWMAENLNYRNPSWEYNDWEYDDDTSSVINRDDIEKGSWCYDNDPENCEKYGRLYTFAAAMEACPSGWHLPTNDEWAMLISAFGGISVAARELKSTTGWFEGAWYIPSTDSSRFSALPGGGFEISIGYRFGNINQIGYWWIGIPENSSVSSNEYILRMNYDSDHVNNNISPLYNGYSVRCIKD